MRKLLFRLGGVLLILLLLILAAVAVIATLAGPLAPFIYPVL